MFLPCDIQINISISGCEDKRDRCRELSAVEIAQQIALQHEVVGSINERARREAWRITDMRNALAYRVDYEKRIADYINDQLAVRDARQDAIDDIP